MLRILLALAFGLAQPWLPSFVPLQCLMVGVAVLLGLWQKYVALRVAAFADGKHPVTGNQRRCTP